MSSFFGAVGTQLETVARLQRTFLGEFFEFNAIVWSLTLMSLCWMLTSFKKLRQARFGCLIMILVALVAER